MTILPMGMQPCNQDRMWKSSLPMRIWTVAKNSQSSKPFPLSKMKKKVCGWSWTLLLKLSRIWSFISDISTYVETEWSGVSFSLFMGVHWEYWQV